MPAFSSIRFKMRWNGKIFHASVPLICASTTDMSADAVTERHVAVWIIRFFYLVLEDTRVLEHRLNSVHGRHMDVDAGGGLPHGRIGVPDMRIPDQCSLCPT